MTYRVTFTPSARDQFLRALTCIRRDDPSAAPAFPQKAEASLSRLRQFAESGRALPESPYLPFRQVIVTPYRFFYRVKAHAVWIVATWHGAQLSDEPPDAVDGQQARRAGRLARQLEAPTAASRQLTRRTLSHTAGSET